MQAMGALAGEMTSDGVGDVSVLRIEQGVQIVTVEASSLREPGVGHVVSRLLALAREEGGRLVVSLEMVEDMTSAGVGGLVKVTDQVGAMGGKLVLVGVRDDLDEVLRTTGLSRKLHIASDMTDGLKQVRRKAGFFGRFGRAA